jgi:hypothetical protein
MLIKNWSAVPWHWDLWRGGVEAQIKAFYFLSILFSHLIIKQFGIFFKTIQSVVDYDHYFRRLIKEVIQNL